MNFLMTYASLKKRIQTITTGIVQRYADTSGVDTETRLAEINQLIAMNIPRTQKDKDGVFVWMYNVSKEFVV